jgi:hypothetical protein
LEEINNQRKKKFQLGDEEITTIRKCRWANKLVLWANPPGFDHLWRSVFFAWLVNVPLRLAMGRRLLNEKSDALHKELRLKETDQKAVLEAEDAETLEAVPRVTESIDAPKQKYEFLAVTLLEGDCRRRSCGAKRRH